MESSQAKLDRLLKVQKSLDAATASLRAEMKPLYPLAYEELVTNLMVQTKHFEWRLAYSQDSHHSSPKTLVLELRGLNPVAHDALTFLLDPIPNNCNGYGCCWVSKNSYLTVTVFPPRLPGGSDYSALLNLIQKCELERVVLSQEVAAEVTRQYEQAAAGVKHYEDFASTIRGSLRGQQAETDKEKLPPSVI